MGIVTRIAVVIATANTCYVVRVKVSLVVP
jgi:hypothetical protein